MKKFFKIVWNNLKIIAAVALICATFYYGYNYLCTKFKTPDAVYEDAFHSLEEDTIDVLVLGSSHAQYSFMPYFFYEDTGLNSYVLGSQFQPLKVSYQMLNEALKTQSPEVLVLEVYTGTFLVDESTDENDSRYITAQYKMTGQEKYTTIDYMTNKEKAEEYKNDFLNNHNNWRTLEDFTSLLKEDDIPLTQTDFGFIPNYNIWLPVVNFWYTDKYDYDVDVTLPDEYTDALNNIYNLCEDNNIQLLLYMMPMDNMTVEEQSYLKKIWEWAKEKNVPYIDFLSNDEELDIRSAIHHDGFHAYVNGAAFVTDYIADYITSNFTISNHTDYKELEEGYKKYINGDSIEVLTREANPAKFMSRFINYPYTVAVSYNGSYLTDDLRPYLNKMGIESKIYDNNSFYGILVDGELVAEGLESASYTQGDYMVEVSASGTYLNGELITDNSELTFTLFTSFDEDYKQHSYKTITCKDGYAWDISYNYRYSDPN